MYISISDMAEKQANFFVKKRKKEETEDFFANCAVAKCLLL